MYRWYEADTRSAFAGATSSRRPWAGGVVLVVCVLIAMLLANLPLTKTYYHDLLETDLSLMIRSPQGLIDWMFPRGMNVETFVNDCLMVIFFFFSVGLEIKREIVNGQAFERAPGDPSGAGRGGAECWPRRSSSRCSTTARPRQTVGESPRQPTSHSPSESCRSSATASRSR